MKYFCHKRDRFAWFLEHEPTSDVFNFVLTRTTFTFSYLVSYGECLDSQVAHLRAVFVSCGMIGHMILVQPITAILS